MLVTISLAVKFYMTSRVRETSWPLFILSVFLVQSNIEVESKSAETLHTTLVETGIQPISCNPGNTSLIWVTFWVLSNLSWKPTVHGAQYPPFSFDTANAIWEARLIYQWIWSRVNDRKYFLSLLIQCQRIYHHSRPLGSFYALATLPTLFPTKMAVATRRTTHNQCDRRGKWRSEKTTFVKSPQNKLKIFHRNYRHCIGTWKPKAKKLTALTKPWLIKYSAKYTRNNGIMYCIRDYKQRQRART